MTTEQITDYLDKYVIKSEGGLATHIDKLKRNTHPNLSLISELAYVLEDTLFLEELKNKNSEFIKLPKIFNYRIAKDKTRVFSELGEVEIISSLNNSPIKTENKIGMTYLDEILEQSNTTSTRHKSKNGETHSDFTATIATENKGIKEVIGKTDYSEINLNILDLMADRFNANKHKYPKGNMLKPIDIKSLEWATFRHIKKMLQPIEDDSETYREHLASVLCNMSMILNQLEITKK